MRIVFMGTPEFALPSLQALRTAGHEIVAVVTQPDRPRGRGLAPSPPSVALAARRDGIPVLQPPRVRDPAFLPALAALAPELIVVVAFGQILPRALLDLPPRGCVNVHASLLPKYRGAAPIQRAILEGETVTGITTMFMNERLDEGDLLLAREVPIAPDESAGDLEERLARVGAALLVETVDALAAGRVARRPQDHTRATLAPRLTKEDGRIRWAEPARAIVNRVRAATPRPGAFTRHAGKVLKVWEARETDAPSIAAPGSVLRAGDEGILVAAGDGRGVLLTSLQAEGKRRLPAGEFLRGARVPVGGVLDGLPPTPSR